MIRTKDGARDIFALKDAELDGNTLKGAAAVMGNIDRGGDCIFPGAFKGALKGFRESGFVAVGHSWGKLPVAMPTECREKGNILYTEAEFHSTEDAQDARTVCMERMGKGLTMGLSIGFRLDWENGLIRFESGQKMLEYAEQNGYDLALFDEKGCRAHKKACWGITTIPELFEYSIVPVPMNPAATITEAKSFDAIQTEREFEEFLRDAGVPKRAAVSITLHGFKARGAEEPEQADVESIRRDADDGDGTQTEQQADTQEEKAPEFDADLLMAQCRALLLSI